MTLNEQDGRIDFTSKVVEAIYKRAGGVCSVPRCKNPTMGPYLMQDGSVNMGEACHIYSASVNGPRGRGGKSEEFIGSEENGIWCCAYHAKLIDKSKGADYPAAVLFSWKRLAEARARKKIHDTPSPLGWIESICFSEFPPLLALPRATLSRFTLLWGNNASGKSSLMEMAASITNSKYAERFNGTKQKTADGAYEDVRFSATVSYTTVDTFSKEIYLEVVGDRIKRREGSVRGLLPPGDLEIVFASSDDCQREVDEDDIGLFTRALNIDKSALYSLVDSGGEFLFPGDMKFQQAQDYNDDADTQFPKTKQNGDPYYELVIRPLGRSGYLPYVLLSGSEKHRVLLDFLIRKAREVSKQRLTLLLIDELASRFDSGNFEKLIRILAEEEFQVLVTISPGQDKAVLDFKNGVPSLKQHDYLLSWRLCVLPDPHE